MRAARYGLAIHLAFALLAFAEVSTRATNVNATATTTTTTTASTTPTATPTATTPPPALPDPRGRAFTFRVRSAIDPGHNLPNAWVYVPHAFDPAAPLHVAVIFHGWQNCIASYVSPRGTGCLSGALHTGYDIPAQVERSGIRALVVVPQLAYEVKSSEGGPIAKPGGLRRFLTELVEEKLAPILGPHRFDDVDRVALLSSSGGWQSLEPALTQGGVDVRDVYLLDSHYYREPVLSHYLARLDRFDPKSPRPMRLGVVYCLMISGSAKISAELGETLEKRMRERGQGHLVHYRNTLANATPDELEAPISVVATLMDHDEVVRKLLWQVLAASGL